MYHYTECGLDNVYLKNGYKIIETPEGEAVSIHNIDNLHNVIGEQIVKKPAHMSGDEFRFLRHELDLSQKGLAKLMDRSDQMIAKWEKNGNIPLLADVIIRNYYSEKRKGSPVAGILDKLAELDREIHELTLQIEETEHGWQTDCA